MAQSKNEIKMSVKDERVRKSATEMEAGEWRMRGERKRKWRREEKRGEM